MGRRGKAVKRTVQGKRSTARSPRTSGRVGDLQERLAEALGQLQTRDRELAEALWVESKPGVGSDLPIHTAVARHGSRPVNPH